MLPRGLSKTISEYGMAGVLVLICLYYSWRTLELRPAVGADGGKDCIAQLVASHPDAKHVAIAAGKTEDDIHFADAAEEKLKSHGVTTIERLGGDPQLARKALDGLIASNAPPDAIVATSECAGWIPRVIERLPALANAPVVGPRSHYWPTFLLASNLLNVANQIAVIAVIAVGMTMVIITGGIDLSVGSLVALSAVVAARFIRDYGGGANAGTAGLIACSAGAIAIAGLVGAFSGSMITLFKVPPFIVTLAMMQVASGEAYILSSGQSIYDIPASYTWLGRGASVLNVPNAVWLMIALFVAAHVLMSLTRLGRYIYAVGGNPEAARLSGVRVNAVLMSVYIFSGLAAGLGGVIVASQLRSGSPTYGAGYELYVIAAVVVGGTSLSGGEGKILGTLIGALIIAVIQNGMNLTGVESYRQKIVLGLVILAAVLFDRLKKKTWSLPFRTRPTTSMAPGATPDATTNAIGAGSGSAE